MGSAASERFRLELSPQDVEARCLALWREFRTPSGILSALLAMQNLFAIAPAANRERQAYCDIQVTIARYAETARAELLIECEGRLLAALQHREVREITRIHGMLSRNGFWQIGVSAGGKLEYPCQRDNLAWLEEWLQSAQAKAEHASGYPDTLNLHAAGIDVAEFMAMGELLHCLRSS